MNEEINTISEEQVLHNKLSFEINQELIHLMKQIDELGQQCKKQKEVIDKIFSRITLWKMEDITMETTKVLDDLLDILKEVSK